MKTVEKHFKYTQPQIHAVPFMFYMQLGHLSIYIETRHQPTLHLRYFIEQM